MGIRPPNGHYHLKANPNPPGLPDMKVEVTSSGMTTLIPLGDWPYNEKLGMFVHESLPIVVECLGYDPVTMAGTFRSIQHMDTKQEQENSGTCEPFTPPA